MTGYWHHIEYCLSVCLSVTLCTVAKRYILQQKSDQMNWDFTTSIPQSLFIDSNPSNFLLQKIESLLIVFIISYYILLYQLIT